jgi:hypothetical protein
LLEIELSDHDGAELDAPDTPRRFPDVSDDAELGRISSTLDSAPARR